MKSKFVLLFLFSAFFCYADNISLPNPKLTPGAVFKNVTKETICTPNYSKSVRSVSEKMKKRVYSAYGITNPPKGEYKIDHLIPLCIGGNNEFKNLWPHHYNKGYWNAHKKTRLEVRLKRLICTGHITKEQAQAEIAKNWITAYKKYIVEKSRGNSDGNENLDNTVD